MLDRTYVAGWVQHIEYISIILLHTGVTIAELILSELLLYSIIGIAQVVVFMSIIYAGFGVSCYGYM